MTLISIPLHLHSHVELGEFVSTLSTLCLKPVRLSRAHRLDSVRICQQNVWIIEQILSVHCQSARMLASMLLTWFSPATRMLSINCWKWTDISFLWAHKGFNTFEFQVEAKVIKSVTPLLVSSYEMILIVAANVNIMALHCDEDYGFYFNVRKYHLSGVHLSCRWITGSATWEEGSRCTCCKMNNHTSFSCCQSGRPALRNANVLKSLLNSWKVHLKSCSYGFHSLYPFSKAGASNSISSA